MESAKSLQFQIPKNRLAFSIKEVGEMLGISRSTVLRWMDNGTIGYKRVGGRVLIPFYELVELISDE